MKLASRRPPDIYWEMIRNLLPTFIQAGMVSIGMKSTRDFAHFYTSEQELREHLANDQGHDEVDRDQYASVWSFARAIAKDSNDVYAQMDLKKLPETAQKTSRRGPYR